MIIESRDWVVGSTDRWKSNESVSIDLEQERGQGLNREVHLNAGDLFPACVSVAWRMRRF